MTHLNRFFIALINYIALVPLVYFIPNWIAPYLPNNQLLHVGIVVALIVPTMSYVVNPVAMHFLGKAFSVESH